MRGEHLDWVKHLHGRAGSPPHARGTLHRNRWKVNSVRITPACAGNTFGDCLPKSTSRDHPRMRGEHKSPSYPLFVVPGSPPHARGTPLEGDFYDADFRITPACAGNTH